MSERIEVPGPDGRTIEVLVGGDPGGFGLLLHGGSPSAVAEWAPVDDAARAAGLRLVTYSRPGYGASTPRAAAGAYVDDVSESVVVLDHLEVDEFLTAGWSGGGPRALACAALLPERVSAVVCLAGLAPLPDGEDARAGWFAGMHDTGALRAALAGRAERLRHAATAEFDPAMFTTADRAALDGDWSTLGEDANRASAAGPDGAVDDDVAYVSPWGFAPGQVGAPVLLVHGGEDRVVPPAHSTRLLADLPAAELWLRPRDGHVSVLGAWPVALDWLRCTA